jgi:hypothetical protein
LLTDPAAAPGLSGGGRCPAGGRAGGPRSGAWIRNPRSARRMRKRRGMARWGHVGAIPPRFREKRRRASSKKSRIVAARGAPYSRGRPEGRPGMSEVREHAG